MSAETRAALLFGQMQEGIKFELMESPAVSGATDYKQLCLSARNEEKRLAELEKRRHSMRIPAGPQPAPIPTNTPQAEHNPLETRNSSTSGGVGWGNCFSCGEPGHRFRDCPNRKEGRDSGPRWGSSGNRPRSNVREGVAKCVHTSTPVMHKDDDPQQESVRMLLSSLYPAPAKCDDRVQAVRIVDRGSRPQQVPVLLEGVPVLGVVDSGADITIMSKNLLERVAAVAKLTKNRLRGVDKRPTGYDGRPFTLHGRMDLDISFDGTTMKTPVYIKLDASEPLLLSEGVCRQLRILSYHPDVVGRRNRYEDRVRSPTNSTAERDGPARNLEPVDRRKTEKNRPRDNGREEVQTQERDGEKNRQGVPPRKTEKNRPKDNGGEEVQTKERDGEKNRPKDNGRGEVLPRKTEKDRSKDNGREEVRTKERDGQKNRSKDNVRQEVLPRKTEKNRPRDNGREEVQTQERDGEKNRQGVPPRKTEKNRPKDNGGEEVQTKERDGEKNRPKDNGRGEVLPRKTEKDGPKDNGREEVRTKERDGQKNRSKDNVRQEVPPRKTEKNRPRDNGREEVQTQERDGEKNRQEVPPRKTENRPKDNGREEVQTQERDGEKNRQEVPPRKTEKNRPKDNGSEEVLPRKTEKNRPRDNRREEVQAKERDEEMNRPRGNGVEEVNSDGGRSPNRTRAGVYTLPTSRNRHTVNTQLSRTQSTTRNLSSGRRQKQTLYRGKDQVATQQRSLKENEGSRTDQCNTPHLREPLAEMEPSDDRDCHTIPGVDVRLVRTVQLLPRQSFPAQVRIGGEHPVGTLLMEGLREVEAEVAIQIDDCLLHSENDSWIVITNPSGFTQVLEGGTKVGEAHPVEVETQSKEITQSQVMRVTATVEENNQMQMRKQQLEAALGQLDIPRQEKETLLSFLTNHHQAFSLEEGERGETDLVTMEINTGDARPRKQAVRRMPPAVRQEISRQLEQMQRNGVIESSQSPWASPVVLVKKRDGSHRFCVDYRALNAVTVPDSFPLPRIDDLLDQLGKSTCFSTIDLASGFWQIRLDPSSQKKTAFVVPQGLYKFRVMPFGLTNAPGVFQRLMQRVLAGLNPPDGPDFVSVYLDDVLVFSRSLQEHLEHLQAVIERLVKAGLKLKPAKCHFVRKELEYLGHVITRDGLKTNPRLVQAVQEFPPPKDVHGVCRFLGLASYYRRFIRDFARIAAPLHYLTRKNAHWRWTDRCEAAFQTLKQKLTTAPILAYPDFSLGYFLETDASIHGLGAVLSQKQPDGRIHPVAYASRGLTPAERNYGITELETLAVVWAFSHFNHFLYGNTVTVYTDHTSVKAVLESPNPTAKHARWWTKVYGRGVREVKLCYRAGRENKSADALSRSPVLPPPQVGTVDGEVQVASVSSTSLPRDPEDMEATALTSHPVPASGRDKGDEILAAGVANKTERSDGEGTATLEDSKETQSIATAGPMGGASRTENREVNLGGARDTGDFSELEMTESTERMEIVFSPVRDSTMREDLNRVDGRCSVVQKTPSQPGDDNSSPVCTVTSNPALGIDHIGMEQCKDPKIKEVMEFLSDGKLPEDQNTARKLVLQSSQFSLLDGVVYHIDHKTRHKCVVAPKHLQEELLKSTHGGAYSGHFSGRRLYNTLRTSWWWETMFADSEKFAKTCPLCIIATGVGRRFRPMLHPIPVQRPFQVLGIDVMDLPVTKQGNRHVVVQDLFTKFPLVFPVPDQKAVRIAKLIAEEVVPLFGVPECLLSDRGTNLLSNVVLDLCRMLGIKKLNTTSHHPQCDGAVERFNRTLKTMLRKHAAKLGNQWDSYLFGVLWAYRNTPHTSTGEKPSFLLFGVDLRTPTEAIYMSPSEFHSTSVEDYREQVMLSLTSARQLATSNIQRAQKRYKGQYDRGRRPSNLRLGEWVFIKFPQDESGRLRKLSRPWRGPYRIIDVRDPDVTAAKVYHPQHGKITVHQSRLCKCPENFPAGYYWYGGKQKGPGRPPKWVETFLSAQNSHSDPLEAPQVEQTGQNTGSETIQPDILVEKTPISASSVDQSVHSGEGMSAIPLEQSGSEEQTTQQDNGTYQESEVDEKTGGHGADVTDPDRSVDYEGPKDNTSKPSGTSNPRQKRNQTTGWKPTNQRKSNKLTKGTSTRRSSDKESDKDGVLEPDGGTVLGPRWDGVQKLKRNSDVGQHKDIAGSGQEDSPTRGQTRRPLRRRVQPPDRYM